jgi:hypothetical protein
VLAKGKTPLLFKAKLAGTSCFAPFSNINIIKSGYFSHNSRKSFIKLLIVFPDFNDFVNSFCEIDENPLT